MSGGAGPREARVLAHLREHLGEPARTLRFASREPAIDVHVIERPRGRAWNLLVTAGMSARPMTVPETVPEPAAWQHAELCVVLPPSWPIAPSGLATRDRWPIDALLDCARLPHERATWLSAGHTVFDGDPWPGTLLTSVLLVPPPFLGDAATIPGDPPIRLLQLVPVTAAELALKKERGSGALVDALFDHDAQVFRAIEATRRCAITGASLLDGAPLAPAPPDPAPDGAWLVLPAARARTADALDRWLDLAAATLGGAELRVQHTRCADGAHVLRVFGVRLVELARTLSLPEHRTAALRLHGERGAARLFHDGDETHLTRGPAADAVAAVAEHVGCAPGGLDPSALPPPETRIVRWQRSGRRDPDNPNVDWGQVVDDELELAITTDRLAPNAPWLLDRFGAWRRAHDRRELALEDHESVPDDDSRADLRAAERAAREAHAGVVELLRALAPRASADVFAALERVLVAGGVEPSSIARFRAWPH